MDGKENSEVALPPPYPTHLPSYDEISQLPSPVQLQLYNDQIRTTAIFSGGGINWQQAHNSIFIPQAPPAYDDIIQHQATGGQPYNSSIQQQQQRPAVTNAQHNQTDVEMSGSLQQRIERRMAAIDEEIRQRRAQRMAATGNQRILGIMKYFNPVGVMRNKIRRIPVQESQFCQ